MSEVGMAFSLESASRKRRPTLPRLDTPTAVLRDAPQPRVGVDDDGLPHVLEKWKVGVRVAVERRVLEAKAKLLRELFRPFDLSFAEAERLEELAGEATVIADFELARHDVRDAEPPRERTRGIR